MSFRQFIDENDFAAFVDLFRNNFPVGCPDAFWGLSPHGKKVWCLLEYDNDEFQRWRLQGYTMPAVSISEVVIFQRHQMANPDARHIWTAQNEDEAIFQLTGIQAHKQFSP